MNYAVNQNLHSPVFRSHLLCFPSLTLWTSSSQHHGTPHPIPKLGSRLTPISWPCSGTFPKLLEGKILTFVPAKPVLHVCDLQSAITFQLVNPPTAVSSFYRLLLRRVPRERAQTQVLRQQEAWVLWPCKDSKVAGVCSQSLELRTVCTEWFKVF